MAGRLATTGIAEGERTRKQILREWELAEQRKFALAEPGGFGTLGLAFHLVVIVLQEQAPGQHKSRARK
jgi:hypothetical protein